MKYSTDSNKRYINTALLISSILITLVLSELLTRSLGYKTWSYISEDKTIAKIEESELTDLTSIILHGKKLSFHDTTRTSFVKNIYEADPILGMRHIPGAYLVQSRLDSILPSLVTFTTHDTRRTSIEVTKQDKKIAFFGCSFTEGESLSDTETYSWILQSELPDWEVLNFGHAGYSTVQSLLNYQKHQNELQEESTVVYSFIEDHEQRNVAAPRWLETLAQYARSAPIKIPYALIGSDGALSILPAISYPHCILSEYSALANIVVRLYAKLEGVARVKQKRETTIALIHKFYDLTKANNHRFFLLILNGSEDLIADYRRSLDNLQIPYIDCNQTLTADLTIPGDGHPNKVANTLWSRCIKESKITTES